MRHPLLRSLVPLLPAICAQFYGTSAWADIGRTAGTFAVSPTGSATYTIPIFAPPGPKGLQPRIALSYDSQAGNGPVGVGWSIAGLSQITRCNYTVAQNGSAQPVNLITGDHFCLDGKHLRLTSSENQLTYGQPATTYQTEIADFSNTTASTTTAGGGPAYFTVQGKDGLTYEYGNGGNSQVLAMGSTTALSWLLDKVTDRAGNTMAFTYQLANQNSNLQGTTLPATISWTPSSHGSSSYNYVMTFVYTTLPSPITSGYVAGTPVQNNESLSNINVSSSGAVIKNYVLNYTVSPSTGSQTLTSVQECADSAKTDCLLPTALTYQSASAGVSSVASVSDIASGGALVPGFDFNGDGRNDLAMFHTGGTWTVAFGGNSGYSAFVNTGVSSTSLTVGDVDGSGQDSFLASQAGVWWSYKWNGSAFAGSSTGTPVDTFNGLYVVALADVNGDGLADLVYMASDSYIYVRLNTTSAGVVSFSSTPIKTINASGAIALASSLGGGGKLDFTGDGQQDVIMYTLASPWTYVLHFSQTLLGGTTFNVSSLTGTSNFALDVGAYNDDSCEDVLTNSALNLSACNGSAATAITFGSDTPLGGMSWNGGSRRSVVVNHAGLIGIYQINGTSLGTFTPTTIAAGAQGSVFALPNPTGDGLDALGIVTGSSPATVQYYLHNGAGTPPDLLSNVKDGFGNSVSPTYQTIAQGLNSTYTESNPFGQGYPYQVYAGPLYVVTQATFSDPSATAGTYVQAHNYITAWMNLQGRGFSGFSGHVLDDSRTGTAETWFYNPVFPYTEMLGGHALTNGTAGNSPKISNSSAIFASTVLDSTANNQRYFPYLGYVTTQTYELGGTANGDLVTTSATNYSYDSYGNATSIATTLTDNDPTSPYNGQSWTTTTTNTPDVSATTWCLLLLSHTQVTYTASSGTAVTRNRSFAPDLTNCRYTQIVTEPSSSLYKVTEDLLYDSFGNVNSDAVTGINMTARPTTLNWGTTGQLPMSVTNALTQTTNSSYDFRWGKVIGVVDANGVTASWDYDAFGRTIHEYHPDGTYRQWSYADCASAGGCIFGSHALTASYGLYDSSVSHNLINAGGVFYDTVDRAVAVANPLIASAGEQQIGYRYDSLGRLSKQSAPCIGNANPTVACPYWSVSEYDILNRLTSMQRPISATNSTLQTTTYQYAGRTSSATDPYLNTRSVVTDVNGWLRQTKDAYGYTVTLAYDAAGSKTGVSDSAGKTLWSGSYVYGIAAFKVGASDSALGSWGYTYDALGELTNWTDAKLQSFSEGYDALSRPIQRQEPDLFTQWTWGGTPSSHNIGQLASVCTGFGANPTNCTTNPGASESDTYDSLARPYQSSISLLENGTPATYVYAYQYSGTTGQLNTLTYPVSTQGNALQLQYGYSNGMLQSITGLISGSPNVAIWTANAQDAAGHLTQETAGNGTVNNHTYDAVTGWLGAITSGVGGGAALQNQSLLYDQIGNVQQRQDNNLGLTENFYYDNDYRLASSKLNTVQNLGFGPYNADGGISTKTDTGANLQSYAATWTSYNYPASISQVGESVQFTYGPNRERIEQNYNSGTEYTFYLGGLMELTYSNGGIANYRHYIYAGNEPVAVYSRTSTLVNTWSYFLADHQGSVSAITNSSGALDVKESFSALGARRDPTTWSGPASSTDLNTIAGLSRQGYTFQTALGQSMGFNHMNGRVQDAITGRFLSPDPTIPDPSNSQDYNRYSYVENNPLTKVDPSGFDDSSCAIPFTTELNCQVLQDPTLTLFTSSGFVYDGGIGFTDLVAGDPYNQSIFNPNTEDGPQLNIQQHITLYLAGTSEEIGDFNTQNGEFHWYDGFQASPGLLSSVLANFGSYGAQMSYAVTGSLKYVHTTVNVVAGIGGLLLPGAVEGLAAESVVDSMATVRALGQAGEDAVRAAFNIGSKTAIDVGGSTRVPDGLLPDVLSEVKNVGSLSYTQQLRDFAQFSRENGMRFDLYVRPTTQLSGPLGDAIGSDAINLKFIPGP